MATYGDPHYDGFPSIHRHRGRDGWKVDDLTRDSLNMQHRSLTDLQENVRIQKEELRRKDELIRELQGLDGMGPSAAAAAASAINACPTARSDLAAMQSRLESLSTRLRQRESELDVASDTVRGLRAELARLRDCQVDRTSAERRVLEFAARIRHQLGVACPPEDLDGLTCKVAELVKENVDMKAKIHGLTDQQAAMELDAKTHRETIERLMAQVNREFRATFQLHASEAEFKTETEKLTEANDQLTKKVELLEIQLAEEKALVAATKADLAEKEALNSKLDCEKREAVHSADSLAKQLAGFVDSLANLMSTAYGRVAPTEEAVRERLRQMLGEVRGHAVAMATLEERVKSATAQLEQQLEANRQRQATGHDAETQNRELREKLKVLEAELAAGDVIRDGLKADKDRLYKYLQRVGQALNMEGWAIDVAFDALGEGLLERAQQLTREAGGAGGGGGVCSGGCNSDLRRRVQALKEQLESKDLHLELMRRRMQGQQGVDSGVSIDGGLFGGGVGGGGVGGNDRERARLAERRLEKAHRMLDEARREADDLRAQLGGLGELRTAASLQDRDLQHLETALEKLERVRQKQAQRIGELKTQLAESRREADDSMRCLAEELRAARRELDEAARRERQQSELRTAVARTLGGSCGGDDADLVARLERMLWQRREMQPPPPPQHPPPPQYPRHLFQHQQQLPPQPHHYMDVCPAAAASAAAGVLQCGSGCDCRRSRRSRHHSSGGGGRRSASCGADCRRY